MIIGTTRTARSHRFLGFPPEPVAASVRGWTADHHQVVSIEVGTRVLLRAAHRVVPLRTLAPLTLVGGWSVTVLAELTSGPVRGELEVAGPRGVVRFPAEVVRHGDVMLLRAVAAGMPRVVQRRSAARVELELALRAAVLSVGSGGPAGSGVGENQREIGGRTTSIGGGGVAVHWDEPVTLPLGTHVYLELELPEGPVVPAVTKVVAAEPARTRLSFVDVAPVDSERLIALVFRVQRRQLAERRRR